MSTSGDETTERGASSPAQEEVAPRSPWVSTESLRRPSSGGAADGDSDYQAGVRVLRTRAVCTRDGRPAATPVRDVEIFSRPRHDRSAYDGSLLLWVVGTSMTWSLVDVQVAVAHALRGAPRRIDLGDGIWCENFDQVLADALRVVDRLATDGLGQPRWDRGVEWLWSQDDALPRQDPVEPAWSRLFGGAPPPESVRVADPTWSSGYRTELGPHWISVVDRGDGTTLLDAQGRVYHSSYPGASRLGVLPGSDAWMRRRGSSVQVAEVLGQLGAASHVVALRRSLEHVSLDGDVQVDLLRRTLRHLHASLVLGPAGLHGAGDLAEVARALGEHPPGDPREGRVLEPRDAEGVLDRALCDRMLSDVCDDDVHDLAAQLRAALAELDRWGLSSGRSGLPVYRCGCGCGREQLARGPSSPSGISPEDAAVLGWYLDEDPSLVRSPLCRDVSGMLR